MTDQTNELPTRGELLRMLKKGEVTVKFRKADKTVRTMRCTLEDDAIPSVDGKVGGDDREVITAYDLDKRAWRSFRMDSLRSVKTPNGTTLKQAAKTRT